MAATPGVDFTKPNKSLSQNEEGVVTLEWQPETQEENIVYELQQSSDDSFAQDLLKIRYQGPDRGSVLTGFPEGIYHFRIRALDPDGISGEWSTPVAVEIKYKPTWQVVILLTAGIVVFFATLITLITCHIRSKNPD